MCKFIYMSYYMSINENEKDSVKWNTIENIFKNKKKQTIINMIKTENRWELEE